MACSGWNNGRREKEALLGSEASQTWKEKDEERPSSAAIKRSFGGRRRLEIGVLASKGC